jgi:hypothetical protein
MNDDDYYHPNLKSPYIWSAAKPYQWREINEEWKGLIYYGAGDWPSHSKWLVPGFEL